MNLPDRLRRLARSRLGIVGWVLTRDPGPMPASVSAVPLTETTHVGFSLIKQRWQMISSEEGLPRVEIDLDSEELTPAGLNQALVETVPLLFPEPPTLSFGYPTRGQRAVLGRRDDHWRMWYPCGGCGGFELSLAEDLHLKESGLAFWEAARAWGMGTDEACLACADSATRASDLGEEQRVWFSPEVQDWLLSCPLDDDRVLLELGIGPRFDPALIQGATSKLGITSSA